MKSKEEVQRFYNANNDDINHYENKIEAFLETCKPQDNDIYYKYLKEQLDKHKELRTILIWILDGELNPNASDVTWEKKIDNDGKLKEITDKHPGT